MEKKTKANLIEDIRFVVKVNPYAVKGCIRTLLNLPGAHWELNELETITKLWRQANERIKKIKK